MCCDVCRILFFTSFEGLREWKVFGVKTTRIRSCCCCCVTASKWFQRITQCFLPWPDRDYTPIFHLLFYLHQNVFKGAANTRSKILIKNYLKKPHTQGKSRFNISNRDVLNQRIYVSMVEITFSRPPVVFISTERSFHSLGAGIGNAWSPQDCCLALGTTRLKCWLDLRDLTGLYSTRSSDR